MLKPAKIDKDTGYRYYSAEQLFEVNRIFIYKELGFTLQQITQLLHEEISTEQIRGMFRLKESEIQQILELEQSKLARIKERMQLIEREGCVEKEQEIIIKAVEGDQFISFKSLGSIEDIPSLFCTFDQLLGNQNRALIAEPQKVLWRESDVKDGVFELAVGYSLKREIPSLSKELQIQSLPAESMMATILFRSDSTFVSTACADLASWIERNGYRIKEDQPGREVYLPLAGEKNGKLVEIQIPIME
jgi:DNA-binding transcriptional MerR regulator